ncbi:polysaccharide export outer membrane protein [Sphingobium sp. B2D3A]|uniref:polysaccharide biosynthesis/export family protein n=1 Tax=unclassified Sphingobium TaxID=2611147 RepID=UPI0022244B28|nr:MULTISPECIES: polysaccharide biosynthesis/export family protein [unclassified Sphingobium]MCW2338522.1 polysaccharide export outer membrane protein [Sphingobium sp. B2D3A]MCW2384980.1 polysaccharide export outer membrane protein [Sphingobium sp. B2D3D]
MTVISSNVSSIPCHKIGPSIAALTMVMIALGGCSSLGSSGPSTGKVVRSSASTVSDADIRVIEVNDDIARRLLATAQPTLFSDVLGDGAPSRTVIGQGDVLSVTIWETPPAVLFGMLGAGSVASASSTGITTGLSTDMPPQMVDDRGLITLPFIGTLRAANKTPRQLEEEIRTRLAGIANRPQVMVGMSRNANTNVTVVGEVNLSAHVPLTPRGERLLDIIASAGGVRQPVNKTMIQITRGSTVVALPMDTVIRDSRQNIRLQASDVVTAVYQPYSFTALGASGANAEIDFEATGISLAQALGRISGLQDNRADAKGVFLFRWEDPAALDPTLLNGARAAPNGKVPVIYRINMTDPATFFIAQSFPIHNRDILYISNAPGVDLQKFVGVITQTTFSVIGITNAVTGTN